ncbi:hypothetical protein VE01_00631 [Pseudogymnoascus verrucosus]|uniref:Cytochrome-b5 reductase n=1 Tax=Pseudogymnoascus verrucosus TaxID=342668 RepID=A0A2P2SW06_9PEZI|nr:uncharacterized protein VE01_00631 [Pseudogymnoascus verrucosus]OBU00982.1 hypothetical protein VE01_00631 [Pseudogymnoascus verrucosus]
MTTSYTLEEVGKHVTDKDCWIVIHNKVYDVTSYFELHPGGAEVLQEYGGLDATEPFEDASHSDSAWETMNSLIVGELAEEYRQADHVYYKTTHEHVEAAPILAKTSTAKRIKSLFTKALALSLTGSLVYFGRPLLSTRWLSTGLLTNQLLRIRIGKTSTDFWYGYLSSVATTSLLVMSAGYLAVNKLSSGGGHGGPSLPARSKPTFRTLKKPSTITPPEAPILATRSYRKFPLVHKKELSPNVYLLVFSLPSPTAVLPLPTGQHVSVMAEINGQSVSRSYTPISNYKDPGVIELVVKVYPTGLLTPHLGNLNVGDAVGFRGPIGAMKYKSGLSKRILMIAGGTGVTPMYQVIRAICEDEADDTTVTLLYANNNLEDILMKEKLDAWAAAHPGKFSVSYVLVNPPNGWKDGTGFVSKEMIQQKLEGGLDTKVMLCGPPGMVKIMKTHLSDMGFPVPGAISKASDRVFVF